MTETSRTTHDVAREVEQYVEAHLLDAQGIMYSGIDSHTDRPFDRDFITPIKVPRRADIDPWAYWTYEDSVMSMGLYIDALVQKHEVTGDDAPLQRAMEVWEIVRNIYSASQVHGIGSFLRPYGGYVTMHRFVEPLGTDQAGPLFSGLWRLMHHAGSLTRRRIADCMLKTLRWYEQQGFEYFYYKFMIHSWEPGEGPSIHNASYYIPAIAWAAKATGDPKWDGYLAERLARFARGEQSAFDGFHWGSDLPITRAILGDRFAATFGEGALKAGYDRAVQQLAGYTEPGMSKYVCPDAKDPGFQAGLDPNWDRSKGMGFPYWDTKHHGRSTPRHERHHLTALAALGLDGAWDKAVEVLNIKQRVPRDFTAFISDDYERIPEPVHLYARSVGVGMIGWLRDYWMLRNVERPLQSSP